MKSPDTDRARFWARLRSTPSSRRALRLLALLLFVALFADFLANDKPLYCRYEGKTYFPVLRSYAVALGWQAWPEDMQRGAWKQLKYESVLWPPVPYAASELDARNSRFRGPFEKQDVRSLRFRHWLGTDQLGRDLLAGMIRGTRVAMLVGIISMGLASLIGIFLGGIAGFFGDRKLQAGPLQTALFLIGLPLGIFYAFIARSFQIETALEEGGVWKELLISLLLLAGIPAALGWLGGRLESLPLLAKAFRKRSFPADLLIMRLIELLNSIPALLLILAVVAILPHPSIFYVMLIIGLISWTGIARFVRAELLRIRELPYIESARIMGFSEWHIFTKQALPNALGPVWIAIAFGFAGAILAEATISFLGIGLAPDEVSWGSLLQAARNNISAWWMAVFPGLAIFLTITALNLLGEALQKEDERD